MLGSSRRSAGMRTIFCATWRAACLGVTGTVLAACGATQPGVNQPLTTQQSTLVLSGHGASGDLLYTGGGHTLAIFTYPDGSAKGTSKTPGAVNGLCSDASGNVYVVEAPKKNSPDGTGYVEEYSHGGTAPIESLSVPSGLMPMDCASDPTSGDLAVTYQSSTNYAPSVAVYTDASGSPTLYQSTAIGADPQCGYDGSGDLFVSSGGNVMAELAAGKSSMQTITLDHPLGGAKHLQWDGTYMAMQSFRPRKHNHETLDESVFQIKVSGNAGKIAGVSYFKGWPVKISGSSWIDGDTIVATPNSRIAFWKYPDGGKPSSVVHLSSHMAAVTVSTGR